MHLGRSFACLSFAVLLSSSAAAQNAGFALDRFEPSERGSDWFAVESLDLRGHQRFATGLVLDYGYRPLVIFARSDEDEQKATIVEHQLFGHLGGNIILWDRLRLGLNLPIAIFQDGEGGDAAGTTFNPPENSTTVGDLRIAADARLVGQYGGPATFAGGFWLFVPTGQQGSYTGDGTVRFVPRLMLAGDIEQFTYAAYTGIAIRPNSDEFAGAKLGSELTWGLAAGGRFLDKKLTVGPELYGSTVITDSKSFFGRSTSPVELVAGTHFQATEVWRFGLGIGPGMTRAFGTPTLRVLASVEWVEPLPKPPPPKPPPPDRDGDGILDPEDACPDVPGIRTDNPATNGCPPPKDRDGDGILDPEDACPDVPGVRTDDPKTNGCPPPKDRDGDGILDADDACPDEPGVRTDDPKTNGCPPPKDSDGDGILDPEDACPNEPGERNEDPKKNGCPVARVEKGQIIIREQVQFAYNSAKILNTSDYILEAVKKILDEHPEIKKVSVEGHTDSKGGDAFNKNLSKRRAASVVNWLTQHKVDKKRFESKGFGEEKPIDSNDTEEGRANNRRVEFHILETGESAADAGSAPAKDEKPAKKADAPAAKPAKKPAENAPAGAADKKPAEPKAPKP